MIYTIFETNPENFYPFSINHAMFEMRQGAFSTLERIQNSISKEDQIILVVRNSLKDIVSERYPDLMINPETIPPSKIISGSNISLINVKEAEPILEDLNEEMRLSDFMDWVSSKYHSYIKSGSTPNYLWSFLDFKLSVLIQDSEKFKKFVNSKKIKIINKNFLKSKLSKESFDLIIGVDIIFNLISANSKKEAQIFLSLSKKYLKRGGSIILEVIAFKKELSILKKKNYFKKFIKLAPSDPYRITIQKYKKIKKNLYIHKKFIDKNGNSSSFSNLVLPIKKSYWKKFKDWNVEIYDYWNKRHDTTEQEYIVILRKK